MIIVAFPFVLVFAVLAAFQRSLIYHPLRETPSRPRAESALKTDVLDVDVAGADGLALHGWLIPAGIADSKSVSPAGRLEDARPLVIWFCGNGGHRGNRMASLHGLRELDVHSLIVDYRGYAENAGSPSESAIAADAREVWRYATESLAVAPGRIVVCGESLGGGVAVRLLSDLAREHIVPGGLVVQASFSSLVDAAQIRFPWLPVRLLLIERYPSADRMAAVSCPVMLLHGRRDRIVPLELGRKLFAAVPAASASGIPKRFVELPQADHNDILDTSQRLWAASWSEFLGDLAATAKPDRD